MKTKKDIRCNNTMIEYNEEELILLQDGEEHYKGCPCCQTDEYLMDLD